MDDRSTTGSLLDALATRTDQVVATLGRLDDDGLRAPSALPGWDRLTIACHLRYGAKALTRMTRAALAGAAAAYYPAGRAAQRPETLRPRRGERPADVVGSLARSSGELLGAWRALEAEGWRNEVREPDGQADLGPITLHRLLVLRLTEVEVHGSDLELDLPDWSQVFVDVALPFRVRWLSTRRSNHRAPDERLQGSWLLVATDGPAHRIVVEGTGVSAGPASRGDHADAVIEASSRDLLALLLGRPLREAPAFRGDRALAAAFSRAFPGP